MYEGNCDWISYISYYFYGVLQSYSDCISGGLSTRPVHVALVSVFWRLHAIVECLPIMDPVMWWQYVL